MDIRLGNKYSNVEFDYGAFAKEADRQGISPEKQANLQIALEKPSLLKRQGVYYPEDEELIVQADRKANSTMVHELRHVADNDHGLISDAAASRSVGAFGIAGLKYGAVPIGAAIVGGKIAGSDLVRNAETPYMITAGVLGAMALGAYLFNPEEIRARREEKLSSPQIVTATPKTK
jgi:hypothetical protein